MDETHLSGANSKVPLWPVSVANIYQKRKGSSKHRGGRAADHPFLTLKAPQVQLG